MLLAVLLAVLPAPIVEGRVGEPSGAGAAGAQVTLTQDGRTQVIRTGGQGEFRFRAFGGPGSISVVLPQGWAHDGAATVSFEARSGTGFRTEFAARARRVLRGRLVIEGAPFGDVDVQAGGIRAHTDAQGAFVADGLPAGKVAVATEWLSGWAEMPAGPGQVTADVALEAPSLVDLKLRALPQPPAVQGVANWLEGKPLTDGESADIERLVALVNLAPPLRLVMVAPPKTVAAAARAALVLQRYLTGPFLVPRERIAFAVGEVAPAGFLALVLMRPEAE
ncbi:MAG: carboxypeptidase-like regulatory domain-containing protein [Myxococcales bacterium]